MNFEVAVPASWKSVNTRGRFPLVTSKCEAVTTIREWLSKFPDDFGFKRKRWQLQMVQEMLVRTGVVLSDHAVRGAMRRARFSFRKSRPAPRKSASEEEQKEFKKETAAQILGPAIPGYVIVALDEAACMIGGWNGYSWLPRGGHETSGSATQRSR